MANNRLTTNKGILMSSTAPVFLFVPVSSAEGIGEYMRSMILAQQVMITWPNADIHFILSKQAPYANDCPFTTLLTEQSPTKHVKEVNHYIKKLRPNIVIFDASGRKSQLQQAHDVGAKVVFISQHKKKRSRGLKLGRLRVTDSHWVVQPEFVMPALSVFQKLKLALYKKAAPINTGVIFTPADPIQQQKLLEQYQLTAGQYLIFNAGSGGHRIGEALAADIYAQAAATIAQQHQIKCVMVYGSNYPKEITQADNVIAIKQLDNAQFINLIDAAKAVVISGGDSLLQTIAMAKPCLTTPVSKDQPARISACFNQGLIISCETESSVITQQATQLLNNDTLAQLKRNLAQSAQQNGLNIAMSQLQALLSSY